MVEGAIAHSESFTGRSGTFSPKVVDAIIKSAIGMFDARNGGFGQAPKFPHPAALDLLIENYARTGNEDVRHVFVTTLEHMANGGVYDQLAGGFHRYSVDERWIVPHFEKMCYDNSELLKNYVHAYQVTRSEFFADIARDIVRWMDEWLSDRERGGFYGSQDADYSMDDDGDFFTWTLDETKAVLTEEQANVATLRYDINEVGEMHHNPAKNVLYVRASIEDIAARLGSSTDRVRNVLDSAKGKMYAARLQRPTPYVDKTIYTGWNGLCISAYLETAKVLSLETARHFALRSLDRLLSEAWNAQTGLRHVIAYSDPKAEARYVAGVVDDYAMTVIACLDAYESTADLSYFKFAQSICDAMIAKFYDPTSGGFFDTEQDSNHKTYGVLGTRRKPVQDSPTPAGNSVAAIALLRLHAYTEENAYREKAERTLEVFAGAVEQVGIFGATYGIAAVHFSHPHEQVVIVGEGSSAEKLSAVALQKFSFTQTVLQLAPNQAVAQNLPPSLAQTIPALPNVANSNAFALVCTGSSCQAPTGDAAALGQLLKIPHNPAA
jgi:uncharacterized protein YyaL (SSP411 family)